MKLTILNKLTVGAQYNKFKLQENRVFDDEINCVVEYFLRLIKNRKWKSPYQIISISLGENKNEWEGDFFQLERVFDFRKFYENDLRSRKKIILDIICDLFLEISKKYNLGKEIILNIKEEISSSDYKNYWYFKEKLFRSPDHKLYAGIWFEWGEDILSAYLHLFEKDKKSIIIQDKLFDIPTYEGENMYYLKPKWLDSNTFLFNNENQKITYSKKVGPISVVN